MSYVSDSAIATFCVAFMLGHFHGMAIKFINGVHAIRAVRG